MMTPETNLFPRVHSKLNLYQGIRRDPFRLRMVTQSLEAFFYFRVDNRIQ